MSRSCRPIAPTAIDGDAASSRSTRVVLDAATLVEHRRGRIAEHLSEHMRALPTVFLYLPAGDTAR